MGKNQGAKYQIKSYPMSPDPILFIEIHLSLNPILDLKRKKKSTKNI